MPESKVVFTKRIVQRANDLRSSWQPRNTMFKDWYNLLSLVDENKTTGLESYTSNDPRTTYNMAKFLLTPKQVSYNIPIADANESQQVIISKIEAFVTRQWNKLERESYKAGRGGWLSYFNKLLLATGWCNVFSVVDGSNYIADIWHPAETFQEFGQDRLADVAHIYNCSPSEARYKVFTNNYPVTLNSRSNLPVEVIDYWCYDDNGLPENSVIIGNQLAKRKSYPELECIPVYSTPVNGLPDMSPVGVGYQEWRKHIGESILAANADVQRNYNRLLSFLLQTARDTAQPAIIERGEGAGVVKPSDVGKRGVVWKVGKEETIETLAMPGIPPEIPLQLQNMRNGIQRGGFADGLFTGVDGSGYLQSLVTANTQQLLTDFNEAGNHVLSDICNSWLHQMRQIGNIEGVDLSLLPEDAQFVIDNKTSVPGDLIQRATTARQLAPSFTMSSTTVLDLLFPEIKDPNGELVLARKDKAMSNELMAQADLVSAFRDQADALEIEGQRGQANLYRQLAELGLQKITAQMQGSPDGPPGIGNAGQV